MPNFPDSRRSRSPLDAAFTYSPMMERIERDRKNAARVGVIAAGIAAAVIAIAAIWPKVFKSSSHAPEISPLTVCKPGDLDCPSNGEPDGCGLLSMEEQLASPLCCPGVAPDAADCPPLSQGGVDAGSSGPVHGDSPFPGGFGGMLPYRVE